MPPLLELGKKVGATVEGQGKVLGCIQKLINSAEPDLIRGRSLSAISSRKMDRGKHKLKLYAGPRKLERKRGARNASPGKEKPLRAGQHSG